MLEVYTLTIKVAFSQCQSINSLRLRDTNMHQNTRPLLIQIMAFSCLEPSHYINALVQEICNSSALAMELRLSCINPSIWTNADLLSVEPLRTDVFKIWIKIEFSFKKMYLNAIYKMAAILPQPQHINENLLIILSDIHASNKVTESWPVIMKGCQCGCYVDTKEMWLLLRMQLVTGLAGFAFWRLPICNSKNILQWDINLWCQ